MTSLSPSMTHGERAPRMTSEGLAETRSAGARYHQKREVFRLLPSGDGIGERGGDGFPREDDGYGIHVERGGEEITRVAKTVYGEVGGDRDGGGAETSSSSKSK